MSTPLIPSAEQLAATRNKLWRQDGAALLTVESLRGWLNQAGLVLYLPRTAQLPGPAPSFVEAVLGAANGAPTLAESEPARTLLARLIAEGSAVPLNLLGTTTDTPDYICSSAVFSYLFTLRGDKTWKQAPATMGAVKVSPLALATYEVIARRVTMSAAELASELGKEVTENAVLRGLAELWAHLRVIPVAQNDGPTMWELTSTRFTKQIKAGANAGQPSALSALISLYLGMAVVASEEEIETILSPVAPRSRIRDVVHALMGARQLETIAVEGRTVLHVAGDLPAFAAGSETAVEGEAPAVSFAATDGSERITKFVPKPRKVGTGFVKRFVPRTEGDRERRPFQKRATDAPVKPGFTKPWEEDRKARPAAEAGGERPRRPAFGGKPALGRKDGGTRPAFGREDGAAPPRREFTPRPSGGDERPPRKTFSKPGTFGRKREDAAGRPTFGGGDERPPRREFGGRADAPARPAGERRPGSYTPRPQGGGEGFAGRKPFAPRGEAPGYPPRKLSAPGGGGKPGFTRDRDAAAPGGEAPRKVFRKFDAPRFDKPRAGGAGPGRPAFDKPRSARPFNPDGPARPPRPSFGGDRPQGGGGFSKPGGSAGKKPFARPGSKPPGTFAKFADGNKPFRKPGPGGKKFGGKPASGGAGRPEYRKRRPEDGESA